MVRQCELPIAVIVVLIAGSVFFGCQSESEEIIFLESLDKGVFQVLDGMDVEAMPPRSAKLKVHEAQRAGVDLMACYKPCEWPNRRLALAYLLVLAEDADYVAYADTHLDKLTEYHEFRMWTFVLENADWTVSPEYRSSMLAVLKKVQKLPYVRLLMAKRSLASGELAAGVEKLLNVMVTGSPWDAPAHTLLATKANHKQLVKLMLSYLDDVTIEGVCAAGVLMHDRPHYDDSVEYLKKATAHRNRAIAKRASFFLTTASTEVIK